MAFKVKKIYVFLVSPRRLNEHVLGY